MYFKQDGEFAIVTQDLLPVDVLVEANQGKAPYTLVITHEPGIYIADANWKPIYHSEVHYRCQEVALYMEYRYYSENREYFVIVQNNGECILYHEVTNEDGSKDNKIVWTTGLTSKEDGPFWLIVNEFGELLVVRQYPYLADKKVGFRTILKPDINTYGGIT